jgi:hypothetical protein
MTEPTSITKEQHDKEMANAIWITRIDAAIADAKFEAEKMGKDRERFIDPLSVAMNICREFLVGPIPQQKPTEEKKSED